MRALRGGRGSQQGFRSLGTKGVPVVCGLFCSGFSFFFFGFPGMQLVSSFGQARGFRQQASSRGSSSSSGKRKKLRIVMNEVLYFAYLKGDLYT